MRHYLYTCSSENTTIHPSFGARHSAIRSEAIQGAERNINPPYPTSDIITTVLVWLQPDSCRYKVSVSMSIAEIQDPDRVILLMISSWGISFQNLQQTAVVLRASLPTRETKPEASTTTKVGQPCRQ